MADEHGSQILARPARAPRFNRWMADVIRPFCGSRVLEIGSGVDIALLPRSQYVETDVNPLILEELGNSCRRSALPEVPLLRRELSRWSQLP